MLTVSRWTGLAVNFCVPSGYENSMTSRSRRQSWVYRIVTLRRAPGGSEKHWCDTVRGPCIRAARVALGANDLLVDPPGFVLVHQPAGQLASVHEQHEVLHGSVFRQREEKLRLDLNRPRVVKGLRNLDLGELVANPCIDADLTDLVRPPDRDGRSPINDEPLRRAASVQASPSKAAPTAETPTHRAPRVFMAVPLLPSFAGFINFFAAETPAFRPSTSGAREEPRPP